ncbi:MAG: efflux RND transporter periplasmic adaptor subunit, partial [Chloroflexi bacterium]|nr:efflux RND transporter periplasmic adaptor subunit [Chloroflexota bacterium]
AAQATLASVGDQTQQAQRDLSAAGKTEYASMLKQQQAAQASLLAAKASFDGALRMYGMYQSMFDHPLELVAAQHAASGQVEAAKAGLKVAQAQSDIVRRGPQAEAVDLAQAKLDAAQANRSLAQAQAARYTIASPIAGTVVDRSVEVGETAQPASPLLTIASTGELQMTVYVPLHDLDAVHVGQGATVTLPSLPGKTYSGAVTYIAPESEFKPANIYNSQERSEMVFAVRVTIENPEAELKAGLPADAALK